MAYDPEKHEIDPTTGFIVDKVSGHRIGADMAPAPESPEAVEYPKWVTPHASHIVTKDEHVSCPAFASIHISRVTAEVTVLVIDAEEEASAKAPYQSPDDGADVFKLPKNKR